jgi:hypothetical protein
VSRARHRPFEKTTKRDGTFITCTEDDANTEGAPRPKPEPVSGKAERSHRRRRPRGLGSRLSTFSKDGPGRPGFPRVLRGLHEAWTARRSQILETTEPLAEAMEDVIAERREPAREVPPREAAMKAVDGLASEYDEANGGFGGPPSFPLPGTFSCSGIVRKGVIASSILSEAKPHLLCQPKAVTDGALPSSNAVAILKLLELAERTGDNAYRERAAAGLRAFGSDLERHPGAVPTLALGVLCYHGERRSVDLTKEGGDSVKKLQPVDPLAQEVVKAEARFTGPAGDNGFRPFRLDLEIREGWHVNAHPASLEYLIPTRLEGKTRRVQYPRGDLPRFDFAQESLAVYSDSMRIRGEVAREERSLRLVYQACDVRRCLPPVEKAVAYPPWGRNDKGLADLQ